MRVQYHGASGEYSSTWPPEVPIPVETVVRDGITYKVAGFQDGQLHLTEVVIQT